MVSVLQMCPLRSDYILRHNPLINYPFIITPRVYWTKHIKWYKMGRRVSDNIPRPKIELRSDDHCVPGCVFIPFYHEKGHCRN